MQHDDAIPRFLVTAGNTREKIDDVRDWGNIFTGETGLSIAKALVQFANVDLITSNTAHAAEAGVTRGVRVRTFRSHADLKLALSEAMTRRTYSGVFMTAAVADYRPVRTFEVVRRDPSVAAAVDRPGEEHWIVRDVQRGKVRSTFDQIAVLGRRTEKLVDLFRTQWQHRGLLVKFKLEVGIGDDELLDIARRSRADSGADYLVANTLEMVRGDTPPGAFVVGNGRAEWVARAELPQHLAQVAARHAKEVFTSAGAG